MRIFCPSHFICLCSERDKSVYFWSRGGYLLYNATSEEENHQNTNLIYSQAKCSTDHHFVYFDNRYGNHSADGTFDIATLTVHFVVKSSFSCLFVNVMLHNNGGY